MQLCRSNGPCSPPSPALLSTAPPGCPGAGQGGQPGWHGAGTGLAQGGQLGSISRVIKSRNASPSSRTGQAEPASLTQDSSHSGELAWRAPSTSPQSRVRGRLWHRGMTPRAEQVLGSLWAPQGGWQWARLQAGTEEPDAGMSPPLVCQHCPAPSWHPPLGQARQGPLAPRRRRRETAGSEGTDGWRTKLARAVPRHPGAGWGPGTTTQQGQGGEGTGTGWGWGWGWGQGEGW